MMIGVVVALVLAAAVGCGSPSATPGVPVGDRELPKLRGIEPGDLNRAIDPCTDFFEFAIGSWHGANPIPDGESRWSRRAAAREANKAKIRSLLEEVSAQPNHPPGSTEQLVGDYYASCMDKDAFEASGTRPLNPMLDEINAAKKPADIQRIIRRMHDLGIPAVFRITGGLDHDEPNRFIATLVTGQLTLPDRYHVTEILEQAMSGKESIRASAVAFGMEERFFGALAKPTDPKTERTMTFAQLQQLSPRFDWVRYFAEAKLPRDDLEVFEPALVRQLDHELQHTPIAEWKTYLEWRFYDAIAGVFEFKDRAAWCAGSTEALLGDALGKKYVEKYFPPAAKAKVQDIIHGLREVLRADVTALTWMTPETKRTALEKLAGYRVFVGYPDAWQDHGELEIRRDAFWANFVEARRHKVDVDRRRVGKPTDPLWELTSAASASPYIDLQLNEIVLPAGYLQSPIFSLDANDAVNYGSIGVSVAHDLTHSIDLLGAENDPLGRPRNWWTDADRAAFAKRGQCVLDQFEGYFIEPGVHHRGALVLGESIGDLAGLRLAHRALAKRMATHPVPSLDGFTPDQQFFIASAQSRGEAVRLEKQREIVKTDSHPVSKFRVIGPLSNLPEFHRAFSCRDGAAMVRPAAKRCEVW